MPNSFPKRLGKPCSQCRMSMNGAEVAWPGKIVMKCLVQWRLVWAIRTVGAGVVSLRRLLSVISTWICRSTCPSS